MLRRVRIVLTVLVVGLAAALVAIVLVPHGSGAESQPTSGPRFDGSLPPPHLRAGSFTLRDQDGRRVSLADYRGRPVVVTFMFTHCKDTCPLTATAIRGALNELPGGGRGVPVLAVSVDPAHDTRASARRFLAKERMTGRMRFLLGSRRALAPVWHAYGIQPHEGEGDLDHTAYVMLVDRRGVQRVDFPAQGLVPEQLSHDLRILLGERA